MKLITEIEYYTRWGEEIFLRSSGTLYPMKYASNGIWRAEIDRIKPGQRFEYRYELHSGGLCRRTEWESHTVELPGTGKLEPVRDNWNEVPDALPLHSAPFRDGVFSVTDGRSWRAAGTAVPVFSLRSEQSFGVGEFNDLKLLADWAAATGQKVIQLLPVNDTVMTGTWADSYPYNANSSFALHPQFIHLQDVGVPETEEFRKLREELDALPQVDYERVNKEKERLLREAFARTGAEVSKSKPYKEFVKKNASWLLPYAAFRSLRDRFGTADFSQWDDFADYDEAKVAAYAKKNKADVDYHCFVQWHLHVQLSAARDYARSKGVIFKGDLPIGVSRTSADAWTCRRLFNLDSQAGAPPDAFSAEGQNWGFPTYNWDEMARDGYAWWKARLCKMSEYFDAFRIDHILGFFRIWEIPKAYKSGLMGHFSPALPYSADELKAAGFDMGDTKYSKPSPGCDKADVLFIKDPKKKGFWHPRIGAQFTEAYANLDGWHKSVYNNLYNDFFYHRHNAFWKESAMKKLPSLLSATGMLACGEDLGMIPDCVAEVMDEYKILSLEIQRMPKNPKEDFADPARYPYYSVCTTSTHDMTPLRAWWEEERPMAQKYWNNVLHESGEAPFFCEPWICRKIIKSHLDSSAMLTVLPLQDWLSMSGSLRYSDPAKERINVPAFPRYYWRYRMHLTLEALLQQKEFNEELRGLISDSGR